ncbi:arabinogalactan O-methyltransferase 1-like isoform X1 [Euphorbia lathyris]|uniref:arabinogalactan O-methyltransferase 1-like isoform X1 n=1 Tax=Euphorbia lathyris TaxID=212925 RepID=UPI0033134DCA
MKKEVKTHPVRKNYRQFMPEKPYRVLAILIGALLAATVTISSSYSFFTTNFTTTTARSTGYVATPTQLEAILHYATTRVVPQQSRAEIKLSFDVLNSIAPCNFLVFGLGHDSLMWTSLNPRGNTIFLEEDPQWVHIILQRIPALRAYVVKYRTHLRDADELLSSYKEEKYCKLPDIRLKGNLLCKLALSMLPDEVYDNEWDVIMIDAPRGYYGEAPGRMGAIFSAAVMARGRTRTENGGVTIPDEDLNINHLDLRWSFIGMISQTGWKPRNRGARWHVNDAGVRDCGGSSPMVVDGSGRAKVVRVIDNYDV